MRHKEGTFSNNKCVNFLRKWSSASAVDRVEDELIMRPAVSWQVRKPKWSNIYGKVSAGKVFHISQTNYIGGGGGGGSLTFPSGEKYVKVMHFQYHIRLGVLWHRFESPSRAKGGGGGLHVARVKTKCVISWLANCLSPFTLSALSTINTGAVQRIHGSGQVRSGAAIDGHHCNAISNSPHHPLWLTGGWSENKTHDDDDFHNRYNKLLLSAILESL